MILLVLIVNRECLPVLAIGVLESRVLPPGTAGWEASQSKCEALGAMHQLQPLVSLKQEWEWAIKGWIRGMGGDFKVIVISDNSVLT